MRSKPPPKLSPYPTPPTSLEGCAMFVAAAIAGTSRFEGEGSSCLCMGAEGALSEDDADTLADVAAELERCQDRLWALVGRVTESRIQQSANIEIKGAKS